MCEISYFFYCFCFVEKIFVFQYFLVSIETIDTKTYVEFQIFYVKVILNVTSHIDWTESRNCSCEISVFVCLCEEIIKSWISFYTFSGVIISIVTNDVVTIKQH